MSPAWEEPSSLLLVAAVEEEEGELVVQFENGLSAFLDNGNAEWDDLRRKLDDGHSRHVPVGVWLGSRGRILDVGWAERDFLLNLTDDPARGGWAWVWFASSGSYPLDKKHPGYGRIAEVIERHKQSSSPVWLVTSGGRDGAELLDLQVLAPEEDALLYRQSNLGWAEAAPVK